MLSLESSDINIEEEFQLTTQNDDIDDFYDTEENYREYDDENDIPEESSVKTSSVRYTSLNARIAKKRSENTQNTQNHKIGNFERLDVGDELSSTNSTRVFQNPSRVAQYTKTFTSGNSLAKKGKNIEIGILKKTINNLREEFNEHTQEVNDLLSKKYLTEDDKKIEEFHKRMQVIELEKQRFRDGINVLKDKKERLQAKFDQLKANEKIKRLPEYQYNQRLKNALKKLQSEKPKDRLFKLQINRQRQLTNEIKFIGSRYAGRAELAKQDIINYIGTLEGRIVKNYR